MQNAELSDARASSSSSSRSFSFFHAACWILFLYTLDQLSKWLIVHSIEFNDGHTVVPGFFELVHVHNTGAAFGSFHDSNTFFIVLSLVTLGVLAACAWRGAFQEKWTRIGVSLLTSGVLGNLTDRFVRKHVVDFLSFDLHAPFAHPWPSFNVADSCICVAAAIYVIFSFRENKGPRL